MSGTQPVAVYAMKVPPGDIMVPSCPEFAAMFRVSMAAIDPTEEPEILDGDDNKPARATLKIVRIPDHMMAEDSDESDDEDYLDGIEDHEDDSDDSEGEVNGGPSDLKKSKKNNLLDMIKMEAEDDDEEMGEDDESDDSGEEAEAKALLKKLMKGKDKAVDGEDSDSDLDEDEDALELEEVVVCTLDPQSHYQQALDFVVGEDEKIFFKVTGTHTIHLTGNYVIPVDDGHTSLYDGEDGEEYDFDPEDEELSELEGDEESDDLDDLEDPKVTEVDSEEEAAPKLVAKPVAKPVKGKNKRPAEDSADEEPSTLDDLMAKSIKSDEGAAPVTNGETKKLSKAEKKKLKKLKKDDGEAAPVPSSTPAPASSEPKQKTTVPKKEPALTNGNNNTSSEKKVQFAKNLEQGPTPSTTPPLKATEKAVTGTLGVRDVQGVTVDDRKLGSGPVAKKGNKIEMRYIGKLENGKQFDANKKGKPFSFKLGKGEVIKGWEVGLIGIAVGGERRLTIPADLGYGKKGAPPDIPPNSKLIFDVKCVGIK